MKTPPITLSFEDTREQGCPVRRVTLEYVQDPHGPRCDIWWKFPGQEKLPAVDVLDSFACGYVLLACTLKQDLVVRGPMTRIGLRNMHRLIELRASLFPHRFHPIQVLPDSVVDIHESTTGPVIAAMSGGVDSTFTVVRHARRSPGEQSYPLEGAVLVHGFDVPLHREDDFRRLRIQMEAVTDKLELPLQTVQTNAIQHTGGTWPLSAMPLFSAILYQCAGPGGTGLVSGGSPLGSWYAGFGHSAAYDDLCSHGRFSLVTDGGAFSRADKIEYLLNDPVGVESIRACWQGPDSSRNCGECPKCILTRLNFLAAGCPNPPCFDTPLTLEHIESLPLSSITEARDFFRFAWVEFERRGIKGPIADTLRRRLRRVPPDFIGHVKEKSNLRKT